MKSLYFGASTGPLILQAASPEPGLQGFNVKHGLQIDSIEYIS
jgi:hypothetical protein